MALDATERQTNVRRTIASYLSGLTLTSTPTILLRNDPRRVTGPFIRFTAEFPGGAPYIGRWSTTQAAFQAAVVVVLDLFYPVADTSEASNIWAFSMVVDELRNAFLGLKLGLNDYNSDPSNPSTVAESYIDFTDPAQDPPREEDGYRRSRIICNGRWIVRHTIARS